MFFYYHELYDQYIAALMHCWQKKLEENKSVLFGHISSVLTHISVIWNPVMVIIIDMPEGMTKQLCNPVSFSYVHGTVSIKTKSCQIWDSHDKYMMVIRPSYLYQDTGKRWLIHPLMYISCTALKCGTFNGPSMHPNHIIDCDPSITFSTSLHFFLPNLEYMPDETV